MVLQGTLFSVINYCPYPEAKGYPSWQSVCTTGKSDEQNLQDLCTAAGNIPSTAGSLASRFHGAQPKLGLDILSGAFTDVEEWVRTGKPSTYDTSNF
jgi:hypothetical protein